MKRGKTIKRETADPSRFVFLDPTNAQLKTLRVGPTTLSNAVILHGKLITLGAGVGGWGWG